MHIKNGISSEHPKKEEFGLYSRNILKIGILLAAMNDWHLITFTFNYIPKFQNLIFFVLFFLIYTTDQI